MDQSFEQFDKLEDILFSNLENLDTFSDLFDFNQLNHAPEFDKILQTSNVDLTNSINSNSFVSSPSEYSQADSLSPEIQADLNNLCSNESNSSVTEPVKMVLPGSEQNGVLTTHELVFKFDEPFENFLVDNKEIEDAIEKNKMEIVVDKDTCIDIDSEDNDSDEYSEQFSTNIEKFKLSEEEKSVFLKEGYNVPTHMPLTKNEQKLLKLVRRKIRNKKSAHISRERKKKYVDGLEKRVEHCTKENSELHKQVKFLKNKNTELLTKLQSMQETMNQLFKKHKKSSTAVLFVSFFLTFFFYPYTDTSSPDLQLQQIPFKGFSRALLSADVSAGPMPAYDLEATSTFDKLYAFYKDRYDL